jgi:hypothetical protein
MGAGWGAVGGRLPARTTVFSMHSHNIGLALADARVADLRRAATHTTATAPPRRRRRRRLALLGLAAAAALFAAAPTGAFARPIDYVATPANAHVGAAPARKPAHDLRSPDARDAAQGRGTFDSPQVVVVKAQPRTRPAVTNGIDWADAGIGAGSLLATSLLALGGTLLITHRRRAAHDTVASGAR